MAPGSPKTKKRFLLCSIFIILGIVANQGTNQNIQDKNSVYENKQPIIYDNPNAEDPRPEAITEKEYFIRTKLLIRRQ